MGALTWIAIIVIVLAVVGLGTGVFLSGVMRGTEKIWESPAVQNVTAETREFLKNEIEKLQEE